MNTPMRASVPARPRAGDSLPRRSWAANLEHWNRYAAVNDEFVDIHMDHDAGRAAGFEGAIGMGNLLWSYLHVSVRDWLPAGARLLGMSCRFARPSLLGGTVTATGEVTEVVAATGDETGSLVTLSVWIEDGTGTVLVPGTARVRLA